MKIVVSPKRLRADLAVPQAHIKAVLMIRMIRDTMTFIWMETMTGTDITVTLTTRMVWTMPWMNLIRTGKAS